MAEKKELFARFFRKMYENYQFNVDFLLIIYLKPN